MQVLPAPRGEERRAWTEEIASRVTRLLRRRGLLEGNGASCDEPPSALDVDASNNPTRYDALTDGILVLRYLFGLTGAPLADVVHS